ncbi:MAG: cation transporter, partial [Planctomycetes bacterium]|nr:cation transporter [Planctomycetota bacterium]
MHCASCAGRVEGAAGRVPGVSDAAVNLADESLSFTFDPARGRLIEVLRAVRDAGYRTPEASARLAVRGMHCASCAGRVEAALLATPGVVEAAVNLADESATVSTLPGVEREALARAVAAAGDFTARLDAGAAPKVDDGVAERVAEERALAWRFAASAVLALFLMASMTPLGERFEALVGPLAAGWVYAGVAGVAQFVFGARFYRGAWAVFRQGGADMNTLVAVGTSAAFFSSLAALLWPGFFHQHGGGAAHLHFDSGASIVALILLGRWLESRARRAATDAVRGLAARGAKMARRLAGRGGEEEVPVAEVAVGDRLRVRPGDLTPVDGVVLEGASAVDE